MQVFHQKDGLKHAGSCLLKLGMEPGLVQQVSCVLSAIQKLLTGSKAAQVLSSVGIAELPSGLLNENCLVQLLYAYLVQWIG